MTGPTDEKMFDAAVDLVRRCGSIGFQIRCSDDEEPTVWVAVAKFATVNSRPVPADTPGAIIAWETAAGLTPGSATFRLAENLVDGSTCAHCNRPGGVSEDYTGEMPLDDLVCWYRYDPELNTFRRGCE